MYALDVLNVNRQRFSARLGGLNCRFLVWWQPSDKSWYGDLEVPLGNKVVRGRHLARNTGLLNNRITLLDGDVYVRALDAESDELGEEPWGNTHALVWEPT